MDSIDEDTEEIAISAPPPPPSELGAVLLQARRDLWSAQPPRLLAFLLGPIRDYALDPSLAVSNVIFLPALLPRVLDTFLAKLVGWTILVVIHFLYCQPVVKADTSQEEITRLTLLESSKQSLLHQSSGKARWLLKPLPDWETAFQWATSHARHVLWTLAGLVVHPQKMRSWVDAMSHFNGFLEDSGVGVELQETFIKPLLRGRLLDDFKILKDILEQHDTDRVQQATIKLNNVESDQQQETMIIHIDNELKDGKRWMRFATAAYGTEMITSTRMYQNKEVLGIPQTISIHTGVAVEDIKIIYAEINNNNNNHDDDQILQHLGYPAPETNNDNNDNDSRHVLHHYVAIDHATKSIVLALRGTLSNYSRSIVDMQGTASNFCSGKAHQGIAELAETVWDTSGDNILKLCRDNPEWQNYRFLITGHSLGAGAACLLNLKLHLEGQLGDRPICCYAFAPPPTFSPCVEPKKSGDDSSFRNNTTTKVDLAIQNTVGYIHDNDIVPFLSISSVRRLATLLDAVDNETEKCVFWERWRMFHDFDKIPQPLIDSVLVAETKSHEPAVEGACHLIIPARVVVWCKPNFVGMLEAHKCDPHKVAALNVYLNPNMLSDHLPETYEDALDALAA